MHGKMSLGGLMHLIELHIVYMSNLWGPDKMNGTCRKIIARGMMNRAVTVFGIEMAACMSHQFVDWKWNKVYNYGVLIGLTCVFGVSYFFFFEL